MRWKTVVLCLAVALAATVGCKQQLFLTEPDYTHYRDLMPANLEYNPTASIAPSGSNVGAPPTVLHPERQPRPLSLAEVIALALENGSVGSPTLNGTANLNLASFSGRNVFTSENSMRVLALDPAIVYTDIEASLAKFDARWTTNLTWTTTDRPVGTPFETFQAGNLSNIQTQDATLQTAILKPLPTGGVAGITFKTDYEFTNLPARVNPSYRPNLQFQFEQPLLQGFGVEINQLRSSHPGSILTPFQTGGRVEGVLITRLRFDQQRAEFERQVHVMLVNVEVAYWNLYGSYWALYSREAALRQAFEAWKINQERFDAGRIAVMDLAQTKQQYESFRAQRIQALSQVLENERALRISIGLPVEDGTQLVPLDQPTLTPYQPDWSTAINEALALRPELILARQDLKFRQLDLMSQSYLLMPDLRLTATYDINSIGSTLDGGSRNGQNALHNWAQDKSNDWAIGLRLDVPLGFRDAHAAVRAARLNLARSYAVLQDQETRAHQYLALQYANLIEFYELIRANRSQREAAAVQLEARFKEFLAGKGTLDFLLESQRVWADALRDEFNSIVQYNNALASFEYAKGTIMQFDNVIISEGSLPQCVQVRAVDHERERTKALVARERAKPVVPPTCNIDGHTLVGPLKLPDAAPPSVVAIQEGQAALPPLPDTLPGSQRAEAKIDSQGQAPNAPAPFPTLGVPVAPRSASLGEPQPANVVSPVDGPRNRPILNRLKRVIQ